MEQTKLMTLAVKEHAYGDEIELVDPRYTVPDPLNREETDISSARVHTLIEHMVGAFSLLKNDILYIIDIPPQRLQHCCDEYTRMTKGDELFPPLNDRFTPLYTVAAGNHMSTVGRAFLEKTPTTPEVCKLGVVDERGRLSLAKLAEVDPDMAQYIVKMRAKRLKPTICDYPHQIRAIAAAMNNDDKMAKTECELLVAAQAAVFPRGLAGANTPSESQLKKICTRLRKEFHSLAHYVGPIVDLCMALGDPACNLVEALHRFHSNAVDGSKARMPADAWASFSMLPASYVRGIEALMKFNWRKEFTKLGVCEGMKPQTIQSFARGREKQKLQELDEFLRKSDKDFTVGAADLPPCLACENHGEPRQFVRVGHREATRDDRAAVGA